LSAAVPRHVAIIMDGNRRWAKARRCRSSRATAAASWRLREITRAARDAGVEILTVYGFSTENWKRDKTEISLLLDCASISRRANWPNCAATTCASALSDTTRPAPRLARSARWIVWSSARPEIVACNSTSRSTTARARNCATWSRLANDVAAGRLAPEAIDEGCIESRLYTAQWPDPELLIRPGGESRLSNFLLFQVAETELYLSDVYWPDFGRDEFGKALAAYRERKLAAASGA
jgi:undecaprenyl diphosphate synthase